MCVYCVSYNEEIFQRCLCVTTFSSTFCISKKCSDFTFFSLTHPPALDSLFQVLSLTLLLRRDRTLRPSLDKLASELAMDSLSLPIFEGIHVERVPDLSSRFNSRPSLWYRASVRRLNRAFCSRNASISLFERSVLLFSRSLSFFRFARSFFNASSASS